MNNQDLLDQVNQIAQQLAEGISYQQAGLNHEDHGCEPDDFMSAYTYLDTVLDVEYTISSHLDYLGAQVLIASGGPTIRINTRTCTVEGLWWGDSHSASYIDSLDLDEACNEMFCATAAARL